MIRLVFGSITASLLTIAPVQNVAAKQPSNQHSFAQFCRDLQAKDDFTANPDEIAEFATKFANEFATKPNGALIVTSLVSVVPQPACNSPFKPIKK